MKPELPIFTTEHPIVLAPTTANELLIFVSKMLLGLGINVFSSIVSLKHLLMSFLN
jgi:hypothetical protein